VAFATAEDVATRLARTLSGVEAAQVDLLLDAATSAIAGAADKSDQWADQLDPIPNVLRFLAIELVVRTSRNPGGLRSQSETLGQYQHSETFADPDKGGALITLTQVEEALVRRTVYGRTTGSAKTESVATEIADLVYGCGS
jgi:hypothetical protein